jgi:hypothetical protein
VGRYPRGSSASPRMPRGLVSSSASSRASSEHLPSLRPRCSPESAGRVLRYDYVTASSQPHRGLIHPGSDVQCSRDALTWYLEHLQASAPDALLLALRIESPVGRVSMCTAKPSGSLNFKLCPFTLETTPGPQESLPDPLLQTYIP